MIAIATIIVLALLAWIAAPAAIDVLLRRRATERLKRREHFRGVGQVGSAVEDADRVPKAPRPLPELHEIFWLRRLLLVFPPYSALGCVTRLLFYNSLLAIPFLAFGREPSSSAVGTPLHSFLAILLALAIALLFRWLALIVVRRDRRWHASYLQAWTRAA